MGNIASEISKFECDQHSLGIQPELLKENRQDVYSKTYSRQRREYTATSKSDSKGDEPANQNSSLAKTSWM